MGTPRFRRNCGALLPGSPCLVAPLTSVPCTEGCRNTVVHSVADDAARWSGSASECELRNAGPCAQFSELENSTPGVGATGVVLVSAAVCQCTVAHTQSKRGYPQERECQRRFLGIWRIRTKKPGECLPSVRKQGLGELLVGKRSCQVWVDDSER